MKPEPCTPYWLGGRTFVPVTIGRKFLTGLVIEADGLHTHRVKVTERLVPVMRHGEPYPRKQLRKHFRRMRPATKGADRLRLQVIKSKEAPNG